MITILVDDRSFVFSRSTLDRHPEFIITRIINSVVDSIDIPSEIEIVDENTYRIDMMPEEFIKHAKYLRTTGLSADAFLFSKQENASIRSDDGIVDNDSVRVVGKVTADVMDVAAVNNVVDINVSDNNIKKDTSVINSDSIRTVDTMGGESSPVTSPRSIFKRVNNVRTGNNLTGGDLTSSLFQSSKQDKQSLDLLKMLENPKPNSKSSTISKSKYVDWSDSVRTDYTHGSGDEYSASNAFVEDSVRLDSTMISDTIDERNYLRNLPVDFTVESTSIVDSSVLNWGKQTDNTEKYKITQRTDEPVSTSSKKKVYRARKIELKTYD